MSVFVAEGKKNRKIPSCLTLWHVLLVWQIPRYILTLHELLAHTPHEHVERNSLDYAKSKLEELSRYIKMSLQQTHPWPSVNIAISILTTHRLWALFMKNKLNEAVIRSSNQLLNAIKSVISSPLLASNGTAVWLRNPTGLNIIPWCQFEADSLIMPQKVHNLNMWITFDNRI